MTSACYLQQATDVCSSRKEDIRYCQRYARFGSKADICSATEHVRFTPESDIDCVFRQVRFGPKRTCHTCVSLLRRKPLAVPASSSELRSRPCGSRQGREAVGTAWGHGCCRSRLWSLPCVSPRSVADRDGRYDLWWPRCTSWASSSTRHLRASDRTGPPPALPALHRRASAPPQANLPQSRGHRWP